MNRLGYAYAVILAVGWLGWSKCHQHDDDHDHDRDGYICSDHCHSDDYCREECFECPLYWKVDCDHKHRVCICKRRKSNGRIHDVPGKGHGSKPGYGGYGTFDEEFS